MGPTACGKTELAVELVQRLPCEIISVDSAMVYRGMDIGTAKPGAEILKIAPHRLLDIRDPAENYSAGDFRKDALREINNVIANNRVPLLVGGTMLYFHALQRGIAELPTANPQIRNHITQEAEKHGWQLLHQRLAQIDPIAAQRIHPNDPQRIQRALEIYELTGKTRTEWQTQDSSPQQLPYPVINIALIPADREKLQQKIAKRFQTMLEHGFIDEVEKLVQRGDLHSELPSMRAVGYRQVWEYLAGKLNYAEMQERSIIATRQLAKRQLTWLRGWEDLQIFASEDTNSFVKIYQLLTTKLNH